MNLKKILIRPNSTIRKTIEIINRSACQIALVVKKKYLLGTVTDGDIRRSILNGKNLDSSVARIMNKNFSSLPIGTAKKNVLDYMQKKNLRQIPMLDKKGRIQDLFLLPELIKNNNLNNNVIIMAGGKGLRLGHLTRKIPKPMLKIHGKPILEIILNNCIKAGFANFYFSVNYLKNKIKNYFKNGTKWDVKISYIEEKKPLGTAGSIGLLKIKSSNPFLIINADVVSQIDFDALLKFHNDNDSDMTICVKESSTKFQYGIVEVDNINVKNLIEKPTYTHFTNAGIYIVNPVIYRMVKKNTFFDMSDLIYLAKKKKKKILAYPIHEFWGDAGLPETLEKIKKTF